MPSFQTIAAMRKLDGQYHSRTQHAVKFYEQQDGQSKQSPAASDIIQQRDHEEGPPIPAAPEESTPTAKLLQDMDTWMSIKNRILYSHKREATNQLPAGRAMQKVSDTSPEHLVDRTGVALRESGGNDGEVIRVGEQHYGDLKEKKEGWASTLLNRWWPSSHGEDTIKPDVSSVHDKGHANETVGSTTDNQGFWEYFNSAKDIMTTAAKAFTATVDNTPLRAVLLREFGGAVEELIIAVHIKKCTNVPSMDLIGHADCYVTVQVDTTGIARDGDSSGPRSKTIYNDSDPVFNDCVETKPLRAVELLSPNAMLRLTVLDWDIIRSDDLVGTCVYPLYETLQCSGVAPYVLSPLNGYEAQSATSGPSAKLFVIENHRSPLVRIMVRATAGAVCVMFTPVAITGLVGFAFRNARLGVEGKLVKDKKNPIELTKYPTLGVSESSIYPTASSPVSSTGWALWDAGRQAPPILCRSDRNLYFHLALVASPDNPVPLMHCGIKLSALEESCGIRGRRLFNSYSDLDLRKTRLYASAEVRLLAPPPVADAST
ncbi:hypothetical protein FOL47_000126 [Perkinsus chesapeaki]|uniref:C2 domain-containing protein n=1 Tax=Perkinsus chesapeaki TaxID=330153 RepID=A0A7J6N1R4_PERCH|nr:hypothetical protein FOL47_000126 [Perkinsus chesapeaki]